ncbi:putative endonuclease [Rhodococcus phage REQ1]|uniref:putative endonuclease n=1 Tax=Rhodococcus phage REQ1 TaxID=1109712 RepID=UPI00023EEBFF|nr:putative endonuclease [Rhodococcus phage REQ1]AEV52026.1 putative endonuclease [Rhodococcus phage REQ1]
MSDNTEKIRPKVDLEAYRHSINILQFVEQERAKINARLEELKEVEDESLAIIQEALGKSGEIGLLDNKPVVTWHKSYQKRLNQQVLKQRYPKIHEECKTELEIRTFKVVV